MQPDKSLYVIGLMSGTSLDGIDAALVKIKPDLSCHFIDGISIDYSEEMKSKIKMLFEPLISPKHICEMNFLIGEYFAKAAIKLIDKTGIKPDLIASHGITFYHNPTKELFENMPLNSTMQIGEGAVIAERTGVTTICDFRPQDMAAGGQGAPLVPFADKIFFKNDKKNIAVLNLGGISNVTVLSNKCDMFAFDIGPANMLIDMTMRNFYNKPFDKNGEIAKTGKVNPTLLDKLLNEKYYSVLPPKSTGRELFSESYFKNILADITDNPQNTIATLTELTAQTIKDGFDKFIYPKTNIDEIILGGGGAYNIYLKDLLTEKFKNLSSIKTHENFGISNKYKEAMAFALLGYCTYHSIPDNSKTATGAAFEVVLGKVINKF